MTVVGCFSFFVKQKTADEMRIRDWSSDLCSSDLDDRFRPLHDFVAGADGAPSPMEGVIQTLGQLYGQLNRMASAANQGEVAVGDALSGSGAAQQLQSGAPPLPAPIKNWVESVAKHSSSSPGGGPTSTEDLRVGKGGGRTWR